LKDINIQQIHKKHFISTYKIIYFIKSQQKEME